MNEPFLQTFFINKERFYVVRISTLHISLYMALAFRYSTLKGREPFQINRRDIMQLAKISARHTYNKGMHELQQFGYIKYIPSTSRVVGSNVTFKVLQK